MVVPVLVGAVTRLLFASARPSLRSLITTIYNKSGKAISQKKLWELTKSASGLKELERIYQSVLNSPTLTSVTKQIKNSKIKMLTAEEASERDIDSVEVRAYLAAKVLRRMRSEGKNGIKTRPFMAKLASNILSGTYSTRGFTFEEIVDYIDNTSLADMIATFKTEALYYG